MVRCKFRCLEIIKRFTRFDTKKNSDGSWSEDHSKPLSQTSVRLVPVQHKGSEENKTFWDATPSGELTMVITNPNAAMQFVEGKVYYLDFTEATE
jgi:hypothetical protein